LMYACQAPSKNKFIGRIEMTPLRAAYESYIDNGWALVPITKGKGPTNPGWNKKENCVTRKEDIDDTIGYGIAHAYSGTMSLDIDDYTEAKRLMPDLDDRLNAEDAVGIASGNPGHAKLLYRMPFGLVLPSVKINKEVDGIRKVILEYRCGTANGLTVQCVLPGASVHPVTQQHYKWVGRGHYSKLPDCPMSIIDDWMAQLEKQSTPSLASLTPSLTPTPTDWNEVLSALDAISPDCTRDDWIAIGMALHSTGNEDAYRAWDEWSAQSSTKYAGQRHTAAQWKSFKSDPDGIGPGSLFHLARQAGWVKPQPDISTLFASIAPVPVQSVIDKMKAPVPTLDLDIFPDILRDRAEEVATRVHCDPIVPLFAGLSAVCAVIDARTRLHIGPSYEVPPILWLMTIGSPGDKKTPGSNPMLAPLDQLEREAFPDYKRQLLEFEAANAMANASRKAYVKAAEDPNAALSAVNGVPQDLPTVYEAPTAPIQLRYTVTDVTSQKLVRMLAERPAGMLCWLDEMSSWIKKVADPKSGEDRSSWVCGYEAKTHRLDRQGDGKTDGATFSDNFALSMYGNIQPRVLMENKHLLDADGLLQRFIPGLLDPNKSGPPDLTMPASLTYQPQWESVLRLIAELPAQTYYLSPAAKSTFEQFLQWYWQNSKDERITGTTDQYMTAFGPPCAWR
jgi:hypothetical protein